MKREGDYYITGPLPETPAPPTEPPPWGETEVVGKPLPRIDAYDRVSGSAVYPSDVVLPDMLYAAVLRCPHAHARARKIDVSRAERMAAVRAVLKDGDPGTDVRWPIGDPDARSRLFDPHCRYEGEAVAAVAAETPYAARDALRAIAVEYDVLPHVSDAMAAIAPGAPAVWEGGNRAGEPQVYERGDLAAGLAAAAVVLEETYETATNLHVPMELHGCVATWDGGRLTVWESSQGVYNVQRELAIAFGLPLTDVRVVGHYVGGGFGSKLSTGKFSVAASLLARKTARPVKLFLSREETQLAVGNRPGNRIRMKAGFRADGTLTGLEMEGWGSGGAYSGDGTGLLDWQVRDLYRCANVRTVRHDVHIHAGDERPMRAPGHPQGSWALEQLLDAAADRLGVDPVELRLRNLAEASQARGGLPYTSNGFRECLTRGAEAFGWKEAREAPRRDGDVVRGVGMAGATWVAGAGRPPSTAIVRYFDDGSVNLNMGASDIGTGTKTVMAMVVAEELGVPPERIRVEHADTATTQFATASGGSKTVPTESPAVRAAAIDCRDQLLRMAADQLDASPSDLALAGDAVVSRSDPSKRVALVELEEFRRRMVVVGVGYRGPNPEDKATCPFAAQFCEVEVDTGTGELRVTRFLGAHDSGRVMNRKTFDNQVYGGIAMGIGFGTTERRVLDAGQTGKMCNLGLHDYKIPTAMDVPVEIASLPVETRDLECNSTGAKGLGEPVTIPTAAAIANAVYHATGIRITETPINTTRLAERLARRDAGRRG